MPTYEYACDSCGHEFEEFQSITAKPLRKCPKCKKSALRRLIGTGAGILFKGSGFYQTDYRSDSYKKAAEKDNGSTSAKSSDKKETKTETKAASTEPAAKKTEKKKSA
ncbi:FmdB family zinc ribbon protein [Anaerobaca lacustris]|uniref:Zinc ribbon domain-containing protein n=1 Tax=Anaerobaca lacustris TaxID=3044600 RepID=A0AAW6TZ16_9BACT|nr:zinc ribbon domain-containing protein [Sedimentisphaerales bacterium M17dextr]